jgi:hypothetical protein
MQTLGQYLNSVATISYQNIYNLSVILEFEAKEYNADTENTVKQPTNSNTQADVVATS